MDPHQFHHSDSLKLNKVVGDLAGDMALLNELMPCVDGKVKYSHALPPTHEIFLSLTAYAQDLVDVQVEMKVEILINYLPNDHLWVYLSPLNMLEARADKWMADVELGHASRLMTFHLWSVERDLKGGRNYPNLKMSMARYLLGNDSVFIEWCKVTGGLAGRKGVDVDVNEGVPVGDEWRKQPVEGRRELGEGRKEVVENRRRSTRRESRRAVVENRKKAVERLSEDAEENYVDEDDGSDEFMEVESTDADETEDEVEVIVAPVVKRGRGRPRKTI